METTCNTSCITGAELFDVVVINDVTEDHKRTAGVEGEKIEVEKEAKRRSEENPNVPLAQIIHKVAGQVQET